MPGIVQVRNSEMVGLLGADLQSRAEPNFAWVNAVSAHLMLPGLRGFWPMSSFDSSGNAMDLSGGTRTLTYTGNPTYSKYDLAPYIDLDGTGDTLSRTDEADLDIAGNESYVNSNDRGISFGCWVNMDAIAGAADKYVMSKANSAAAGSISYAIKNPLGVSAFQAVFGAAAAIETQDSGTIAAATWYHVVARWYPVGATANLAIFLDGVKSSAATALGLLVNIDADFRIGSRDDGARGVAELMAGTVSLAFLCTCGLSDVAIWSLYQQTKALFGKRQ